MLDSAQKLAAQLENDMLLENAVAMYDEATMKKTVPKEVFERFKDALVTGAETKNDDKKVIAEAVFGWARSLGATSFAHWFFPMRDLDWSSDAQIKPSKPTFPADRLFGGESDGSSFPNGGLRCTHAAAAFTTWDRSSPLFVYDNVLRIPCCFVTHHGKCIDDKTPLLRSQDAVDKHGVRLLKAMKKAAATKGVRSYLGWEQEFFVVSAELYKKRPDLVNCGRTLMGKLPPRSQEASLNYFGPVPPIVQELLVNVQAIMIKLGSPMTVRHNEVAPAQHEMSPIFCASNASCDSNVIFMEVCTNEAKKLGLMVLFHEKPFQGINGSGKHNNWSLGTYEGINLFQPGKTDDENEIFVAAVACLSYGLATYNELVRCAVATAGNDHRLGGQEAPPAIVSFSPGAGFEAHVDEIIKGGSLLSGDWFQKIKESRAGLPVTKAAAALEPNIEDRNRTAPFPWCGNRFEFRAVGSSQNCSFPITVCNLVTAAGMDHLASLLENGTPLRDAVALTYKQSRHVIFTGNGYAKEWPQEAEKRGLPNLPTTPEAIAQFDSPKNKALFSKLGVFADDETTAKKDCALDNYTTVLQVEVETMISMVKTGILPACAKDLALYVNASDLTDLDQKKSLYTQIKTELAALVYLKNKVPTTSTQDTASFLCDSVKPQMDKPRGLVDQAEGDLDKDLYPFPNYQDLLYSHHF